MSDYNDREQNRVVGQVASAAFFDASDSIVDVHSAVKVLAITVTAEFMAIAMLLLAKEKVLAFIQDEGTDLLFYGGAFFFFNGLFIMFAVYRLAANKWPHRGAGIFIWLASIIAGALNVLVGFAMLAMEWR